VALFAAGPAGALAPTWASDVPATAAGVRSLPFPRLANIFLLGAVEESDIPMLAKWDLLVLSPVWTDDQLARLRALNPDILLFAYVSPYAVSRAPYGPNELEVDLQGYASTHDLWWYDAQRARASDWPNTWMVNPTALAPTGPSGSWRTFLVERVVRHLETHPQLDGVFLDNLWTSLSWAQPQLQLDSDCNPTHAPAGCDGRADAAADLDARWNAAMRALAGDLRRGVDRLSRRRARPCALLSNGATDYFESLNGTTIENFPRGSGRDHGNPYGYNWYRSMLEARSGYLEAPFYARPWPVSILNAGWWGTRTAPTAGPEFERHKRYTLASTLLGDGFYSLDRSPSSHSALWWEVEYDRNGAASGYLGAARGAAFRVLQPEGPELLADAGYEATTGSPWIFQTFGADATCERDAAVRTSGQRAVRITVRGTPHAYAVKLYQSPLRLAAGTSYTLRFLARAASPLEILVHAYATTCPASRCLRDVRLPIGKTWKLYEYSFVSTGDGDAGLNIFVTQPGTVWLDDASLRRGDTGVFRRNFDHGLVLLNTTRETRTIQLGGTFQRLFAAGNPAYDGAVVTEETLAPSDGRILLRVPARRGKLEVAARSSGVVLHGARPNPCNPSTSIRFDLGSATHVRLQLHDVAGRLVRTLADGPLPAGAHAVGWDGRDDAGRRAASGAYLCRLEAGPVRQTAKLIVLE
jgi:hypothetical protein